VPVRNSNGSPSGSVYQPGRYGGSSQPSLGSGQLSPGIFSARSSTSDIDACNNGDVRITDGVRDVAYRLSNELQPLYLGQVAGLSLVQIGLLGSFFSGAMMLTPLLSGRLADRYGERVPISAGFLIMFAAFMVFLQGSAYLAFILAWILFGMGVGLFSPAYQSLISKVVPRHSLGTFSGLFQSSLGFISLPAPWIGALLWERFTPRLPFLITALVSLVTVIPAWLKFRLPKQAPQPLPVE
jgi:MFS family permease